jgi:hypothetical protein
MTEYKLVRTSQNNLDLQDPDGNVIKSYSPPVRTPDELLPAIFDDLGINDTSVRSAIKIATTGKIDIIDNR